MNKWKLTDFEKEAARLLNGILIEDLTPVEKKLVKMLVGLGALKVEDNDGDPIVGLRV